MWHTYIKTANVAKVRLQPFVLRPITCNLWWDFCSLTLAFTAVPPPRQHNYPMSLRPQCTMYRDTTTPLPRQSGHLEGSSTQMILGFHCHGLCHRERDHKKPRWGFCAVGLSDWPHMRSTGIYEEPGNEVWEPSWNSSWLWPQPTRRKDPELFGWITSLSWGSFNVFSLRPNREN